MDTEARLAAMERQVRWLRAVVVGLLLGGAGLMVGGATTGVPAMITARQIQIVDAQGVGVISIGEAAGIPAMMIADKKTRYMMMLKADEMVIADTINGMTSPIIRIRLNINSFKNSALNLMDVNGKVGMEILSHNPLDAEISGSIGFGVNGKTWLGMAMDTRGGRRLFVDAPISAPAFITEDAPRGGR
jgi:hypothetical protein